ncbi:hypothetical protein [Herpetosiphon llansteffanensis]|uniref:hypothetical protein n=1 Tax=Herpetosiphon llansteffanensis TaxID=2094568 RepID=UPI000D7CAD28|nr:hypothetical protein [Herpetosiphon llansteffanensis]
MSDQAETVVIVGPCAAGKTTLRQGLETHGIQARVIAQEHSGIRGLWRKHQADYVIYLDVDLPAVHERGRPTFPAWLHNQQQQRLQEARDAADIYLDTTKHSINDVLRRVLSVISH